MAQMYPRQLKTDNEMEKAGLSAISPAERKLFDLFKKHLPDEYSVFHGLLLQAPRPGGGIYDREIDFIIAHPEYGLLCMEVKGGLIQVSGKTGEWTSRDRFGKIHEIKDPFAQIKNACYDIAKVIRESDALKTYDFSTWYAVALPDVDVEEDLGPGSPREIIIDRGDTRPDCIEAGIRRTFAHYRRNGQKPLGDKGIKALTRKIVPDHFLRSYLATDFKEEEDQFHQLTVQQYAVLEFIEDKPRAMIAGCAGSGKTMLAVEKARRLSSQGKRVLFTCYNRNLAEWLGETFKFENVTFQHFHSLAATVTKDVGKPLPWDEVSKIGYTKFYNELVPEALFDAASSLPEEKKFDAVIVDEGQDFRSTFWEAIQMMLREPDTGIFYIFYDDSQRLYSDDKFPFPEPAGRLNRNMRSTFEIGERVVDYYCGVGTILPAGPKSGRKVEEIDLKKYKSPEDALADVLGMLADEKVKPADIVVLTPLGEDRSVWKDKMVVGGYVVERNGKLKGNEILVSTIHAFKGLERPVVILSELSTQMSDDNKQLLYVALSRARNHVVVLGKLPQGQGQVA